MSNKEDLLRVLIDSGYGSRRKIASAIMDGKVTVNGEVATNLRQPVNSRKDRIEIGGKAVDLQKEKYTYLVMNKPSDVLSSVSDDRGRDTVVDMLPFKYRNLRLYPVGRLDLETTGLILLTNDGDLTNRLTHPRYEIEKEYLAVLDKALEKDEIAQLESGIELEDGMSAPAKVARTNDRSIVGYTIVIHEGRKRQVRRMFRALGRRVLRLKRIRMGALTLENLREGEVREIAGRDLKRMFDIK